MTSTNTVTATLTNWFLPAENVVFIKPAGWIHENDRKNVLRATFLATGCALAGLDIVEFAAKKKSLPFITDAFQSLGRELNTCRTAIRKAQQNSDLSFTERLQLRAWAIDLAARISHAAIAVSSGAAIYSHHNAQRVYREALVFTVTGQNSAVMKATLERLVRKQDFLNESQRHKEYMEHLSPLSHNINYSRVIHLSHIIDTDIPLWEGDPPIEFETVAELDRDGYYLRRFSMGEHSATHMNAPNSFYVDGVGCDRYSADSLIVPAVVINICEQASSNSDYVLSIDDLLAWEQQNGEIPPKCLVLLYTGWQEKWLDEKAFFNRDTQRGMHFPGFSSDATKFLLEERQIAGIGIDTHGVDAGQETTFATNCLVLKEPRIVLENLTNLDQLPLKGTTLVIGILRLKNGSGSPAAVMALIP
jgi:kynurenine formamidase